MAVEESLVRASLSDQIKDRLLARITDGALKPGDRIVELRVAAEMQTSQAPVREALRELEAIGVVETLRNKGARVRVISDREFGEIYDVRAQLEGYATSLVAGDRSLLGDLNGHIAKMRKAAKRNDRVAFAGHNSDFHRAIMVAAGNRFLAGLWETLDVKVRTVINVSRGDTSLARIAETHTAIVDAIDHGDPVAAREVAVAHVLAAKPNEPGPSEAH